MNKFKGKALSLVLSLALVISSFSAVPASAATKTVAGELGGVTNDKFYLVNGGTSDAELTLSGFGALIKANPTMTIAKTHKPVDGVKIAAISRKSGDNLVKWYDANDNDGIDSDTVIDDINLELRNASVSGTEELNVLYKGTYTDENDKEYTVRDTQVVTIRVYDKGEVVLGEQSKDGKQEDNGVKGELDSDFAQKTVSHETATNADGTRNANDTSTDSKTLVALKAVPDSANKVLASWEALDTTSDPDELDSDATSYAYYLKSSSPSNIDLGATNEQTDHEATKPATITDPALTLTGSSITLGKVLSGVHVPTKYYYTESDAAPELDDATAETPVGKTAATKEVPTAGIAGLTADKTLTIVGYADTATSPAHNWVAVTKPITVDYVHDATIGAATLKVKGSTDPAATTVTADLAPNVAATVADSAGTITVTAPTAPIYFYKVNDAATWNPSTTDPTVPTVDPGHSYKVELVAVPAGTAATDPNFADKILGTTTATFTKKIASGDGYVTARVKDKANPASFTFTLQATKKFKADQKKDGVAAADKVSSLDDVKQKSKITKTILVNDPSFTKLNKYKTTTYISKATVDKDTANSEKVNVNGYEVKFATTDAAAVTVSDKANVSKITGTVANVTVDGGSNVGEISSDALTSVSVADAKVDTIAAKAAEVSIDSEKANVGEITKSKTVTIKSGKIGNVVASVSVDITPDDDERSVTVGDIEAATISIDANESNGVKVGTLKATDDESEIKLTGDNDITIGGIDFDYYGAELKLDGFKGTVPAPKNSDASVEGATISTQQADDKVAIKGDTDINSLSIAEESTVSFDGKLNVGSIDGSGKLIVGLGKLNVESDASDVKLQIADTYKVGDVAYTSAHDTIDVEDMNNYGFTVTKSEASSKDTFKIASTEFVGLSLGTTSANIAEGYTQTFKATPYAPGTAIPEGYHVAYTFDGDDTVFSFTDNKDGTATIKTIKTDASFDSLNKGTLKAELVDADEATNDEYDAAELDVTATKLPPVAYISDTSVKNMKVGEPYRFRITSVAGTQPKNFVVASNAATVTYRGNSGKDYFYDVKAVKEGSYGVYVAGTKLAVLNITNAFSIDTKTVSVNAGASYQFKVTGPSQPRFQVAGVGDIKLTSKSGNNYFFKVTVPSNLAKGGHGVYVNGVAMAVVTVK